MSRLLLTFEGRAPKMSRFYTMDLLSSSHLKQTEINNVASVVGGDSYSSVDLADDKVEDADHE